MSLVQCFLSADFNRVEKDPRTLNRYVLLRECFPKNSRTGRTEKLNSHLCFMLMSLS